MERARHRKTKSASGIEGIQQIQKQKESARLSSDSRSYIDGRDRHDMFMPEFGQSPSARETGIPMKKLLADEMSKEAGPKRHSPSVIARLMGLEGMPSPRHVHRQQKRSSDISTNLQKNSQLHDDRLNKRRSNDHQEFKDVYEDLEASHVMNRRSSSRWNTGTVLTKPEMALIRQKFNDAKRLSTDERLQDSKELNDTLEMLDSNKDLLLQYLHKPDSLFGKHLPDLKSDSKGSVGSHISVLKPSSAGKYESKAKSWRSEKDKSNRNHSTSNLNREDGLLLEPHSRHRTRISHHSSRIQLDDKNEEQILPTKIVVLKPNLGKMQSTGVAGPLHNLSHGYQPNFKKEFQRSRGSETVTWIKEDSFHDEGLLKPISKEAREIAREITMRMRNGYHDIETVDTKSLKFKGYVGDESSYDANECDSESGSEEFKLSYGNTFSENEFCRYRYHSGESSVSREAKKRLSERWIMTHKYQDLEMVSKGNTLGEMLSLAKRETRSHHLNSKTSLDRPTNQRSCKNGTATRDGPIGISSRDGWKDVISRNVSRSRSLPPSTGGRVDRRSTYNDHEWAEEDPLMHGGSVRRGRSKGAKGNQHRKNDSSEDPKSRNKMPYSSQHKFANEIESSIEAKFEIQMEANTKVLTEQQYMVEMAGEDNFSRNPESDAVTIAEPGSPTLSTKSLELLTTQSCSGVDNDKSVVHVSEDFHLQEQKLEPPKHGSPSLKCHGAELESSESSKEADHPSPVSVLEVPFTDETLSSESFERVSAELHELRMQLQLLKMESGTHTGDSSLIPIDEEATQLSPHVPEPNQVDEAITWETSYIIDLLIESGLEESDFNIFRTRWPSHDSPLDPNLFDHLEKQYSNEASLGTRSDRRFLFDVINSSILDIFQEHIELYPWVMLKLGGLNLRKEGGIQEALEKLMSQDFFNEETLIELETLDKEMQWSGVKDEIDEIGNEIEGLLINDMVMDLVCRCR